MPVFQTLFTDSNHEEFQRLSGELEKELFLRDGDLAQINFELNKIDSLPTVILLVSNSSATACGAFLKYDIDSVEIKRMYVLPEFRRNKLASKILSELELMAKEAGYKYSLLETGRNQPEAISLYLKQGYREIPNFGKYAESVNSICFRKSL